MKKLIYKISEEEKNRILGLHRKQVIIERSQNKKLLSESEIKILLKFRNFLKNIGHFCRNCYITGMDSAAALTIF